MLFKVESNKRCGLYLEKKPHSYVTEYSTRYDWSEYCIGRKILFSHKTNMPFGRDVLHTHEFYELTVCVDCVDAVLYTDENKIKLSAGQVVLVKPDAMHMYRAQSSQSRRDFYVLNFRADIPFPLGEMSVVMDFLKRGSEGINCILLSKNELEEVTRLLEAVEKILSEDTEYSEAFALTYIFEIFLILSSRNNDAPSLMIPQMPRFIKDIKQYIDENFTKINTASEVAVSTHYSREYISRTFKKHVNISIYEYIISKKILNACELINKGYHIESAAVESGFNNMASFNKHFKRIKRMTPSEYRALNRRRVRDKE